MRADPGASSELSTMILSSSISCTLVLFKQKNCRYLGLRFVTISVFQGDSIGLKQKYEVEKTESNEKSEKKFSLHIVLRNTHRTWDPSDHCEE